MQANLQALLFIRRHGAQGYLYDDDFTWTAIENGGITIKRQVEWGLLSVFCLGDRAEGVTISGVQYPVNDGVLTPEFPLGVSNHLMQETARVEVLRGALIVGWQLENVV